MTPTRKRFIEMMELKGYTEHSIRNYTQAVSSLALYHKKSPLELTSEDIRLFLLHIKRERRVAPRTFNIYYYGIRAFYTLMMPDTNICVLFKRLRVREGLPVIPSKGEMEMLLHAAKNIRDRVVIAVLYSSGVRLSECINLKLTDIDSKRMVIRVEQGKGRKDRFTLLSERTLLLLRDYCRKHRPKCHLFEKSSGKLLTIRSIERIVRDTCRRTSIKKKITPHTLRHAFATHLLEDGVPIQYIQKLLGHSNIKTTLRYTHVSMELIKEVKSPFDSLDKTKTGEEVLNG